MILSAIPKEKHGAINELIQSYNKLVNLIENSPQTTKGWYGNYMVHITSITECTLLLAAGANREGINGAAMVNGLI